LPDRFQEKRPRPARQADRPSVSLATAISIVARHINGRYVVLHPAFSAIAQKRENEASLNRFAIET
jgi:hypothetical protein